MYPTNIQPDDIINEAIRQKDNAKVYVPEENVTEEIQKK